MVNLEMKFENRNEKVNGVKSVECFITLRFVQFVLTRQG